jgi:hypothetical protein
MASVNSLALVAAQPVHAAAHGAFRNGSVLQAKVITAEANVARLAIDGQTIEVTTPIKLQAGTTLRVSVDNSGGALKLVIQGSAAGHANAPPARAGTRPAPAGALAPLISALQIAIAEALLTAEATLAASRQAPEETQTGTARQTAGPSARRPQTQAQAQSRMGPFSSALGSGSALAGVSAERLAAPHAAPSSSDAKQPAHPPAAYTQNATAAPAENSPQMLTASFYAPQLPYPFEARIEHDKDGDEGDGAGKAAAARGWTVSLSVDGGPMGLIHISVGFRANAVSVRIAAEEAQAAAELRTWLPELRAALEDADLAVDELSARQGDAFDRADRRRSIVL